MSEEIEKNGPSCPKCKNQIEPNSAQCVKCGAILLGASTMEERLDRIRTYSLGEILLKEREYLFEAIYSRESLLGKMRYYFAYALIFSAIYGLFLGGAWGIWQIPIVAAKISTFLFSGLLICMPLLYTFNIFMGSRLSFIQTCVMISLASYLMGVVMIAFAPVLLLFVIFSGSSIFVNILNILSLAIASSVGIGLLWNAIRYFIIKNGYQPNMLLLKIWIGLYVLVVIQVFWTLRIFVGKLKLVERMGDEWNFYEALFELIQGFMGS